jgi:putative endopeptidase
MRFLAFRPFPLATALAMWSAVPLSGQAPGDDFFAYANAAWLKATTIPAGKDRWGARDEINDVARRHVMQLLDDARNAPAGSLARKVADFRAAYSNDAIIEARGLAPLKPLLDSIDRIADKAALATQLGRTMRADVDPLNWGIYRSASLLGLSVEPSIHGEKTNVAFLVQGGLGLPDREHFVSVDPRMLELRSKYRAYVATLLTLTGVDRAQQRADAVVALETAIAQAQTTREASANDHRADTLWTRSDFAREAPGFDWPAFFAAAGLATQDAIVPWQPTAIKGTAALVASESLETWKDYLRVRAIDAYSDVLPREIGSLRSSLNGETTSPARSERAASATQLAMAGAVGRMYAERHFPAEQKARVQRVVSNVSAAFIRRIEAVTWMSPATKALAIEKVKHLYIGIGYPERWPDHSDLIIDAADAVGNYRRVADWNYRAALSQLGKPVDQSQWWMTPQTAGAILAFQQNSYDFTAALLQPPKYDAMASEAATYGAIGAIIGHDIVHFVDVLGAEYEVNGRMQRWWTSDDVKRYEAATEPLAKQFAEYRPFPHVAVDGKLSLRENIADLGGLAASFDAYRLALRGNTSDAEYVRQQDREFFIAFAQSWRAKLTDDAMRTQAATNDHAPEVYRIATVRNMEAWYNAFDVKPGQRLYLAPAARIRIW